MGISWKLSIHISGPWHRKIKYLGASIAGASLAPLCLYRVWLHGLSMQPQHIWTSHIVAKGSQGKCPKRDQHKLLTVGSNLTCSRKSHSIISTVFYLLRLSKSSPSFKEKRHCFRFLDGRNVKEFAAFLNCLWDTNQHYRIRQPVRWKCEFVKTYNTQSFRNSVSSEMSH